MKEILLTKGKVAYVSDIDYPEVRERKWCCSGKYAATYSDRKTILLHSFVSVLKNTLKDIDDVKQIDHIDGNTYNCTRSNLRSVTSQQNSMNSHATWAGSGVRGVYANRNGRRYTARLVLDGKTICLGVYDTISEAAEERRTGELKYYGEFANKKG